MIVDKVQIHPIHLIRYWSYLFTGIHYDKLSLLQRNFSAEGIATKGVLKCVVKQLNFTIEYQKYH